MSGNANREVASRACQRHNRTFNQQRTRESSGTQWGPWLPPECPDCSIERAQELQRTEALRKFEEETLPARKDEFKALSEKRFEEERAIHEETILARAEELETQWILEMWAKARPEFLVRATSQVKAFVDSRIVAEEREFSIEKQKQEVADVQEELQKTFDEERDQKLKESLREWAALG